eukprot:TRINITY_DN3462_c0_g2_i7.p2 TRINITY_DN3462_c0_g2~~TRINITY_DN3462_c0_g2_i7.p2  ORF type:complete len:135 (+),score=30.34 TRINITY_DN3462_c0_g2_i7:629-1033(+)
MIEPSGLSWGYFGCASGKAAGAARTEIEKLDLKNMKCKDAIVEAAKMCLFLLSSIRFLSLSLSEGKGPAIFSIVILHLSIYHVHDEIKDKLFELEMAWICSESKNTYQLVPVDLLAAAEKIAKEAEDAESSEGI